MRSSSTPLTRSAATRHRWLTLRVAAGAHRQADRGPCHLRGADPGARHTACCSQRGCGGGSSPGQRRLQSHRAAAGLGCRGAKDFGAGLSETRCRQAGKKVNRHRKNLSLSLLASASLSSARVCIQCLSTDSLSLKQSNLAGVLNCTQKATISRELAMRI